MSLNASQLFELLLSSRWSQNTEKIITFSNTHRYKISSKIHFILVGMLSYITMFDQGVGVRKVLATVWAGVSASAPTQLPSSQNKHSQTKHTLLNILISKCFLGMATQCMAW